MKTIALALGLTLAVMSGAAIAKEVKCTCGEKVVTGSCPDHQAHRCDCAKLAVECYDSPYQNDPKKPR